MLSVVMPVYNERNTFPEIFERVLAVKIPKEIIIVDNCSTDGTVDLLKRIKRDDVRVFFQPRNQGKGTSVRLGIEHVRGELTVVQDADLEYDPEDFHKLLEVQRRFDADAVFGARRAVEGYRQAAHFQAGNRALSLLFSILYGQWVEDVATCYKLVRTSVLQSLRLETGGFDLDFEIPAKLARGGWTIHQVPITYRPRTRTQGKKIRITDGLWAAKVLVKWRVAPIYARNGGLGGVRKPAGSSDG